MRQRHNAGVDEIKAGEEPFDRRPGAHLHDHPAAPVHRGHPFPRRRVEVAREMGQGQVTAGGQRVPKDSARIEAYGTVDELNAFLGLACVTCGEETARARASGIKATPFNAWGVQR